jgi:hypothetical protein
MDPVTAICTSKNLPRAVAPPAPGTPRGPVPVARALSEGVRQLKLSPQAQELPAFGLSMVKPCFSMVSAKSIVAPSR